ncbi:MAG: aminomethyl-transferring glycine dehydrogenase [Anaerolineales bacterium]|nr:aminomethyl-transferring glycine dehydrogenase [Anaerolineales bacterium]
MTKLTNRELLRPADDFAHRHIGPRDADLPKMLQTVGYASLDALTDAAVPDVIRIAQGLNLPEPLTEVETIADLRALASKNKVLRSFIGQGFYDTVTPAVIQRNILENPGWYTQYTPYQPEISQGRLEALINFQTMITDLTGMAIANASMLDEGTAAAEAMALALRARPRKSNANVFFVSEKCHPHVIAVVQTRAEAIGVEVFVGDHATYDFSTPTFGVLVSYPTTDGEVLPYADFFAEAHKHGALTVVDADLLALTILRPPWEFGADVAVGNTQRFGVPMGFGGPHAAYMAVIDEQKRVMPGRLIGVSVDSAGKPAYRLSLQTREQHIRREKATSNICTAQVLLAIMASMYAVYHGPEGLRHIAQRVHLLAEVLREGLRQLGYGVPEGLVFDTVTVSAPGRVEDIRAAALARGVNLAYYPDRVGVSLDEAVEVEELATLFEIFGAAPGQLDLGTLADAVSVDYPAPFARASAFLTHPVFNSYHSETEMLRYIHRLQAKDLSLAYAMIPLGSCTMKLNATTEMIPVTWPEFGRLHPFAPADQTEGYQELFRRLETWLNEITGFAATSLQPNAGSQGEYTGLLTIRAYHKARGDDHRNICLIPASAHGTNPASSVMAGMDVVVVDTDEHGNIKVDDLRAKAEKHRDNLAALMVTYPSTHGVFESAIKEICRTIHANGGQVYMDGANMNALVGLAKPGEIGADVCHLNLHKTFSIPHGGGGPGMGPICVAEHLAPYLPNHPQVDGVGGATPLGTVSSGPWGSPSVLVISYAYIRMMGGEGLKKATQMAILNANYIAERLEAYFPVLYRGENNRVAHECIVELRHLKEFASVDDVAKRLMDYGFHAPTMSFPVPGTLMIEPTESESLEELDRFCEAMIAIREEIGQVERGEIDPHDNPLANSPHTAEAVLVTDWEHPYSREVAAFPSAFVRAAKFWPAVGRIDNVYGDRNLFCACVPIDAYHEPVEA